MSNRVTLTLTSFLVFLNASPLCAQGTGGPVVQPERIAPIVRDQTISSIMVNRSPSLHTLSRRLRVPMANCGKLARGAINRGGLRITSGEPGFAQGSNSTATASVACVELPGAGPCERDGAAIVIAVASTQDLAQARTLARRLDSAVGDPVLMDCN